MNNINQIGYGKLPPIVSQPLSNPVSPTQENAAHAPAEDQVQISQMAQYLSKIATVPEIRTEKVQTLKQAIAEGTYDYQGKLSVALDRLLDEHG